MLAWVPMNAAEKLRRIARKRVSKAQHLLVDAIRPHIPDGLHADDWLIPEEMTLAYYTPAWAELRENERLALNHWVYALLYTRISDGEEYVLQANAAIAEHVRSHEPEVAALFLLENREEVDHIAAFRMVRDQVMRNLGLARLRFPRKRGRGLFVNGPAVRTLLKTFGADYVVTYFLARGIANHMGKGYEVGVAGMHNRNAEVQRLSLLHSQDESHHMAISRLMSAGARELLPPVRGGRVYRRMRRAMQRTVAYYTFAASFYQGYDRQMSELALGAMPTFRGRSRDFVHELLDAHFATECGIERSRNKFMGRPNRQLLEGAALLPEDKELWYRTLVEHQGNLRFFDRDPSFLAVAG